MADTLANACASLRIDDESINASIRRLADRAVRAVAWHVGRE